MNKLREKLAELCQEQWQLHINEVIDDFKATGEQDIGSTDTYLLRPLQNYSDLYNEAKETCRKEADKIIGLVDKEWGIEISRVFDMSLPAYDNSSLIEYIASMKTTEDGFVKIKDVEERLLEIKGTFKRIW